ncbi:hypothetical protein Lal_00026602 [Lupinus albus]|nr:hypothetical protein Lal_00026602 [Lupinus albus]
MIQYGECCFMSYAYWAKLYQQKYHILVDLAIKLAWIISLLQEIKLPIPRKPILCVLTLISAKALASNLKYHSRSKYIEVDIRVVVAYVPTKDQTTYCLTKAITHTWFNRLRDKLEVVLPPLSLIGASN